MQDLYAVAKIQLGVETKEHDEQQQNGERNTRGSGETMEYERTDWRRLEPKDTQTNLLRPTAIRTKSKSKRDNGEATPEMVCREVPDTT